MYIYVYINYNTIIIKYVNCNYKRPTKTLGFTNLLEKTSSGKSDNVLVTFPSQQHYLTKYFTRRKHFSKQKLKLSYR